MINQEPYRILGEIKNKVSQEQYEKLKVLVDKPREKLSNIPLLLPILASFGLVTTFYGFEKLLDQSPLVNQPIVMIVIGIVLLLLTGAAAKKL